MLPVSYLHKILAGSRPSDFATSSCLRPFKLRVLSSDTSQYQDIVCDCGKCLRCQDIMREQWVSRMCLHSFGYKYCYFVTLTYGSYNLRDYIKHPFKEDWLNTFPVKDSSNSKGVPLWTPSLICTDHVQKYFKRLRKSTKADLSFTYASEYGSEYSRPHHHLIVWSNSRISRDQFLDAWSYDVCLDSPRFVSKWTGSYSTQRSDLYSYYGGYRTVNGKYVPIYYRQNPAFRSRFYIGDIDYHNLTENGSMNWNSKYEKNLSRNNAFSYVAKYVGKKSEIPPQALKRMRICFDLLPYTDLATDDIYYTMQPTPLNICIYDPSSPTRLLKYTSVPELLDKQKEQLKYKKLVLSKNRVYEKITFEDFKQIFAPGFGCSRKNAIGKNYFVAHFTELSQGCTDLPCWQGKNLTFPSYFARLLSEQKYPLRYLSHSLLGDSYSKGSLPRLYEYFSALRLDPSAFYRYKAFTPFETSRLKTVTYKDSKGNNCSITSDNLTTRLVPGGDMINPAKKDSLANPTLFDPINGKVHYQFIPHLDTFEGYAFDPHTKEYHLVDYIHRIDFCDLILDFINRRWDDLPQREEHRRQTLELYELVKNDPMTPPNVDRFIEERKLMQKQYKSRHLTDKQ